MCLAVRGIHISDLERANFFDLERANECGVLEQQTGYQWMVGKGNKIRSWEDQWFGQTSLAITFKEISYYVCD